MFAKNLVKVSRIGKVMSRKAPPPSSSAIKLVLSKHVVLIMRIISIIITMDNIRQEKPNKSSILKLNKRLK